MHSYNNNTLQTRKTEREKALYLVGQDYENYGGLRGVVMSDYFHRNKGTTSDNIGRLVEECRHELGEDVTMAGMPSEAALHELISATILVYTRYRSQEQPPGAPSGSWVRHAMSDYADIRLRESELDAKPYGLRGESRASLVNNSIALIHQLRADRERRVHINNLDVCIDRLAQNADGIEMNLEELRRFRDELVPAHGPKISRFLYPSA